MNPDQQEGGGGGRDGPSTPPQLSLSELNRLRTDREEEKRKESRMRKRNESVVRMEGRPNPQQQPQGLSTQDDQNDDEEEDEEDGMDIDTTGNDDDRVEIPHSQVHAMREERRRRREQVLMNRGSSSNDGGDGTNSGSMSTTNSTMQPPSSSASSETHVNLKVVNSGGNEVFFKIKKTQKLGKLMNAYCHREGLVRGSVRFTVDGNRIDPDKTVQELGLSNQDIIDAMVEQTGGSWVWRWKHGNNLYRQYLYKQWFEYCRRQRQSQQQQQFNNYYDYQF